MLHETAGPHALPARSTPVSVQEITIDVASHEVYMDGAPVFLTYKERALLHCLASRPGRVFTRSELLSLGSGRAQGETSRTLDVHVRRLRSKLNAPQHEYVQTVRKVGYKFIGPARFVGT
ncbi:MAG: winged helix-turn-helix transcriptional regulator [Chloroflexi bacterium]|nr:winged helix-turn-helix transcriptional regulator [Chloroflexota bacterium]